MKAVYIDTRHGQEIRAYAVSVTRVGDDIVLRYAAELPRVPLCADLMIIDRTGYRASSSAGFCKVFGGRTTSRVIGELTLERGLRPVAPREVTVLSGAVRKDVKTHRNSNPDTADAAYGVLRDLYENSDKEVLLMWGQSDFTDASVVSGAFFGKNDLEEIPEEHRTDVVNRVTSDTTRVMENYYRNYYWDNRTPTQHKHDFLRAKAIAYLLGYETNWDNDTESMAPEIAEEIVRRLARKGDNISNIYYAVAPSVRDCSEPDIDVAELVSKARAKLAEILPVVYVEASHIDYNGEAEDKTFTWRVPDGIDVSVGDRVIAETRYGYAEVLVRRVYRGVPGDHKPIIRVIGKNEELAPIAEGE